MLYLAVFWWVLRCMIELAPGRDHQELARAITEAALEEPPLFKEDPNYLKTVSLMTAVAFRESGFVATAVGDNGHSFGAFQHNDVWQGARGLLGDPRAQARTARWMLGISVKACPAPVSWYATGGCYERGRQLSEDRMALSKKILAISLE